MRYEGGYSQGHLEETRAETEIRLHMADGLTCGHGAWGWGGAGAVREEEERAKKIRGRETETERNRDGLTASEERREHETETAGVYRNQQLGEGKGSPWAGAV